MEFGLTEAQKTLQSLVREFVAKECPPSVVNRWDEAGEYPTAIYQKMAALGLVGLVFPEEFGGSGGSILDMCILAEELGRAGYDLSAGLGLSIFCGLTLLRHGSDDQKHRFLPPLIAGDIRFSIAITEPDAGSDAANLKTLAQRDGNGYRVSGQKIFTTGAHLPGTIILTACRTNPSLPKHQGISILLIPNNADGVSVSRLRTMGRNITGTNIVYFNDVWVPEDNMLGPPDQGWPIILSGLQIERIYVSAAYVGAAQSAVDEALAYAKERRQFGRPIGEFQAIAHLLADMQTRVDAARLLVYRAAWLLSQGQPCDREISEAKLFCSETFVSVTGDAIQVLGGYGYTLDSSAQRHFRDARSTTITGGTSQVQRTIIARSMGLNVK